MGITVNVLDEDVLTGLNYDPAFYVTGTDNTVVIVTVDGEERYGVVCIGEMRIDREDGSVWRYASDLYENNISTDNDLYRIPEDEWSNNAWFEIWDYEEQETLGVVFHDSKEALDYVMELASSL
jgi:hypothetical protein